MLLLDLKGRAIILGYCHFGQIHAVTAVTATNNEVDHSLSRFTHSGHGLLPSNSLGVTAVAAVTVVVATATTTNRGCNRGRGDGGEGSRSDGCFLGGNNLLNLSS